MKIVIDVPEKTYNRFCQCYRFPDEVEEAVDDVVAWMPFKWYKPKKAESEV